MNVSVILAAGEGTRMKSSLPKVLHKIAGKSLLSYVLDACKDAYIDKNIVVVGHKADQILSAYGEDSELIFKSQPIGEGNPYGTGFAVMQAVDEIDDEDNVIILNGDSPLITSETIKALIDFHNKKKLVGTVLTAELLDPTGYGRIVRNERNYVTRIVEQRDANEKEKAITEVNSGVYVFKGRFLKEALKHLDTNNVKGELYLTDVVEVIASRDYPVGAYALANEVEVFGINTRVQLSQSEKIMRRRINDEHMINGVTIIESRNTVISHGVKLGRDVAIYPGVVIEGATEIGDNCTIYGNTRINNCKIGSGVEIKNSYLDDSIIGDSVTIGPFANIRPGSVIEDNVKIGNFVEVKNSNIGSGTKISHLTYVGDSDIGKNVNVGCGVVTVNYNGVEKNRTTIGDNAFIGCNVNLIAPVEVKDNAYIAAGSTITKNVEDGDLAIERTEQRNISGWVKRKGLNRG